MYRPSPKENDTMTANLTPKQRKAIEALLTNGDISHAATAAGVSRDTLYRWMQEETFKQALEGSTRKALEGLSRALVALGGKATETLDEAMTDGLRMGDRIRASDIVLSRLLQLRELVDLETRVSELERKISDDNQKQN